MPARPPSPAMPLALLALALVLGCQRADIRKTTSAEAVVPNVTPAALFEVALLHARRGDSLRAEQYLSAARAYGYDEAAATYWLVRVCLEAGRYQSARTHAIEYLRDHPGHWVLRLVVATIHEALGDLARARTELERVVESEPLEPLGHYRLAMLYRRLESSPESRTQSHLEAYLKLAPQGAHAEEVRDALRRPSTPLVDEVDSRGELRTQIGRLP